MAGFLSGLGSKGEKGFNEANNAGTYFGAADQSWQTLQNMMGEAVGLNPAQNAASTTGLPGSKMLGHVGGAISALGLADNIYDMSQNGLNVGNGMNAASNALNVGSWGAATFGAAGGAASTVAAPLMAAGAAGLSLGMASNDFIADMGWLGGHGSDPNKKGRSWSEMAGDWGAAADDWAGGGALGTAAGIGATLAGSVVGTAGTIASAPLVIGRGLWNGVTSLTDALFSW